MFRNVNEKDITPKKQKHRRSKWIVLFYFPEKSLTKQLLWGYCSCLISSCNKGSMYSFQINAFEAKVFILSIKSIFGGFFSIEHVQGLFFLFTDIWLSAPTWISFAVMTFELIWINFELNTRLWEKTLSKSENIFSKYFTSFFGCCRGLNIWFMTIFSFQFFFFSALMT